MSAEQAKQAPNGAELKAAQSDFVEITDGKARILVPKSNRTKRGPGRMDAPVFYNPAMEQNRDISVLVFQSLVSSHGRHVGALDGLAASGIRGIRFCKEVGGGSGGFSVTINDWSKESFALIRKNIERNCIAGRAEASNRDLNALLCERSFDYIDIDPFGTPVEFVDNALRSVRHKGIIGITATDTATLCGAGAKACIRRYGAKPLHCEFMHEIGLRVLAGHIVRTAAKYDRAALPILCYAEGHYMRCYFEIKDGAQKADALLKKVGFAHYCRKCGRRSMEVGSGMSEVGSTLPTPYFPHHTSKNGECNCGARMEFAGPLWAGALFDGAFLEKLATPREIAEKKDVAKLVSIWRKEAEAPPLYYTTGEIARLFHVEPPAIEDAVSALNENGFFACRTHFDPTGFKTDASFGAIKDIVN